MYDVVGPSNPGPTGPRPPNVDRPIDGSFEPGCFVEPETCSAGALPGSPSASAGGGCSGGECRASVNFENGNIAVHMGIPDAGKAAPTERLTLSSPPRAFTP